MKNKLIINEDKFNIEINEWNDFTLGLLKLYSDWKCNGYQVPVAPPVDVPATTKKKLEDDKQEQNQGGTFRDRRFLDKYPLAKASKYGNTPIHAPILEHILKLIPDKFTNRDIYEAVYNFYKESDREIKLATACAYGGSYCKYMLDKNIITESDEGFLRVKKNQSYQIKS